MASISNFFAEFFQGLLAPLRFLLKWGGWMATVIGGFVFLIVKFTWSGIDALYTQMMGLGTVYDSAGNVVSASQNLPDYAAFFLIVNTFFPLDLVIAMFSVVIQLWMFWITYRAIKSWIPSLS